MSASRGRVVMSEFSDARFDGRVLRQANALASDGWRVRLIMYREDITAARARVDRNLTLLEYPLPGRYKSGGGARNLMRRLGMLGTALRMAWRCVTSPGDVYHAHNFVMGWALWLGAAMRGARYVYDAHELSWDASELHFRVGKYLERFLLKRADLRLCPSQDRARLLSEYYGVPEPLVIGNYLDAPAVAKSDLLRERLRVSPETAILYYSGSLFIDTRLQERVVEALPELNAVFVLVGSAHPSEHARLMQTARSLGVHERVHILPPVPHAELLKLTASADVGICLLKDAGLAYRYHALNKFYEYAACGVPVLASELPTFRREVLEQPQGPIGAVCRPDDRADVVRALRSLIEDRDRLSAMGQRARALAESQWNWAREEGKLRDAYSALASADVARAAPAPSA